MNDLCMINSGERACLSVICHSLADKGRGDDGDREISWSINPVDGPCYSTLDGCYCGHCIHMLPSCPSLHHHI